MFPYERRRSPVTTVTTDRCPNDIVSISFVCSTKAHSNLLYYNLQFSCDKCVASMSVDVSLQLVAHMKSLSRISRIRKKNMDFRVLQFDILSMTLTIR